MSYTVELNPSGTCFSVSEEESILDAALRQGVLLPYGCRNGACGSCKGRVLEGSISYPNETSPPKALSEREHAARWALLCQAHPSSDLRIAALELDRGQDLQVRTLPARVAGKERLAHDVMAVHLVLPPTERLQYLAGQYIDFLLRDGRRRAFSLANAPHDDERLTLHIRHIPGGSFSGHVFTDLKERALLRLQGPLGSFFVRDGHRPLIFVAGGTGFAPIKAMIEHALHEGVTRQIHLYWGVRAERDLYLGDLAAGWDRAHENVHFVPVLSEPADARAWGGRIGLVHEAVLADFSEISGYDVYASGPPVMVHAVRDSLTERGLPLEQLYSDTFDYAYETGHDG